MNPFVKTLILFGLVLIHAIVVLVAAYVYSMVKNLDTYKGEQAYFAICKTLWFITWLLFIFILIKIV